MWIKPLATAAAPITLRRHPSLILTFLSLYLRHDFQMGRGTPRERAASNTGSLGGSRGSEWGPAAFLAPCPITTVTQHAASATGLPKDSMYVPRLVPRSILRRASPRACLAAWLRICRPGCPYVCARILDCRFSTPFRAGPKPVSAPSQLAPVAENCVRLPSRPAGLGGSGPSMTPRV